MVPMSLALLDLLRRPLSTHPNFVEGTATAKMDILRYAIVDITAKMTTGTGQILPLQQRRLRLLGLSPR